MGRDEKSYNIKIGEKKINKIEQLTNDEQQSSGRSRRNLPQSLYFILHCIPSSQNSYIFVAHIIITFISLRSSWCLYHSHWCPHARPIRSF